MYSPFPVRCDAVRAVAAHCKRPFALRPGLSQEDVSRTKKNYKRKESERKDKGTQKKEMKEGA